MWLMLLPACAAFSTGAIAEIPLEYFARAPETHAVRISPQGDYLGVVRTVQIEENEDKRVLVIFNFPSMTHSATLSFPKRANVGTFYWVNNSRVIATVIESDDSISWDYSTGELYGMNADGSERGFVFGYRTNYRGGHRILNFLQNDDDKILIEGYKSLNPRNIDTAAYRLNVYNGDLTRIARAPTRDVSFMADADGNLRYAFTTSDDFERVIYKFNAADKSWTESNRTPFGGAGSSPAAMASQRAVYVEEAEGEAPVGIYRLNVETGEKTLIYQHDYADANLLVDQGHNPYGAVVWAGYPEFVPIDDEHPYTQLILSLDKVFPGKRIGIANATKDLRYIVVFVAAAEQSTQYYLYDRTTEQPTLSLMLDTLPWLQDVTLASVEPIEFKARDGLVIRGFLTRPNGSSSNLPMVVMPHGGPFGVQDRWQYDPDVQLLASRGYAVLQMNFRGSGGYGPHFESLGIGERGFKMQDDVTDATLWAIEEGIADPERICIYGWSHGGYAALRGAVKEPELYQCVIGAAGVYDFELQYRKADYTRYRFGRSYMKQSLGDDKDLLREISPARQADKIVAPVFLVHGKRDARVPIEHAKAMRKALRKAGNSPRYLEKKTEGHGFYDEQNRVEFYGELLSFLNEHIGAGDVN